MDPVTAIRSQLPLPASPSSAAMDNRLTSAPATHGAAPVAEVQVKEAVRQPTVSTSIVPAHLAERDEASHPAAEARAAADAAREAYIRASIAAGISPLPLPGA